jgi:hypothetical protein
MGHRRSCARAHKWRPRRYGCQLTSLPSSQFELTWNRHIPLLFSNLLNPKVPANLSTSHGCRERESASQPLYFLVRGTTRRCQPTSLNASCLVLIVPADLTIRPVISAQFASQPLALVPRSDLDVIYKCISLCLLRLLPANLSIEAERSLPIWTAL